MAEEGEEGGGRSKEEDAAGRRTSTRGLGWVRSG
jgi:hypothetical protein